MISYPRNIDLDSIHSLVTEINREFGKSNNKPTVVSSGGNQLVADVEVGIPTTELVAENINSGSIEVFGFNAHLFNGNNTPVYSFFLNNDKNNSHYHMVGYFSTHGGAVTAFTSNDSSILGSGVYALANDNIVISGNITIIPDNKSVHIQYSAYRTVDETTFFCTVRYTLVTAHNELFKFSINSSIENTIVKNSHLRIWRMF